jgi:hypothetical protein
MFFKNKIFVNASFIIQQEKLVPYQFSGRYVVLSAVEDDKKDIFAAQGSKLEQSIAQHGVDHLQGPQALYPLLNHFWLPGVHEICTHQSQMRRFFYLTFAGFCLF